METPLPRQPVHRDEQHCEHQQSKAKHDNVARLCAPTLSPGRIERLLCRRLGGWQYESRRQRVFELVLSLLRAGTGAVDHYYQLPGRENIDSRLSRYSEKADLVELRGPFG